MSKLATTLTVVFMLTTSLFAASGTKTGNIRLIKMYSPETFKIVLDNEPNFQFLVGDQFPAIHQFTLLANSALPYFL